MTRVGAFIVAVAVPAALVGPIVAPFDSASQELALRADIQFRLGQVDAARASVAEGLAVDQRNTALLQLRRKIG